MSERQFSFKDGDGNPVFIDCYGCGPVWEIETRRGKVLFAWSNRFGPLPEKKNGSERILPWNHPFWRVASLWNLQGRRAEGSRAIWHEPKQPILQHLGGRNYEIIEDGEPGYDW